MSTFTILSRVHRSVNLPNRAARHNVGDTTAVGAAPSSVSFHAEQTAVLLQDLP